MTILKELLDFGIVGYFLLTILQFLKFPKGHVLYKTCDGLFFDFSYEETCQGYEGVC